MNHDRYMMNKDLTIDQLDTHLKTNYKVKNLLTLFNRIRLSDDQRITQILKDNRVKNQKNSQ